MRRTWLLTGLVGTAAAGTLLALSLGTSPAQVAPASRVGEAVSPSGPSLPITQVVLFNSGVGYFQREGQVEGNARVDLAFRVEDINDLIKSMILQDFGGGHVSAVSYDSHDPIERTLRSFALDLTENPSLAQILNQARGEKADLTLQPTANSQPAALSGTIVGIEQTPGSGDGKVPPTSVINLWCADGLRAVKLSEIQRIRFLNPTLEKEFRQALQTLALSRDTLKKAVSLSFTGDGKRPVRVGYVVENPIWKTSYRLVLNKEGKPFLQGWAVVENPSDEDWNDIQMGLVAGRPISFRMDLYQPLYVQRPLVEPELFASLRPPTYSAPMEEAAKAVEKSEADAAGFGERSGRSRRGLVREQLERQSIDRLAGGNFLRKNLAADIDLGRGVASAATAQQLGDSFQYVIDHPVSLARQKSALLPIVQQPVEAQRVSIYNESTHAKFPLLGLRFTNSTGLHLMQGPITVFDHGNYAGDARIQDLQPKEDRLLSYAIDLGSEVETKLKPTTGTLTALRAYKGLLITTTRVHEARNYHVKNRSDTDRVVLVEHPYRSDFRLVSKTEPKERARDVYRFQLDVPAGKDATLDVEEERDMQQQIALSNSNDETIRQFLRAPVISEPVKKALQQAMSLKGQLTSTRQDLQQKQRELKAVMDDQGRLRENLKAVPQTAAAYKRFVDKFDQQETEIEKLNDAIQTLQREQVAQQKAFDSYLANLNVE